MSESVGPFEEDVDRGAPHFDHEGSLRRAAEEGKPGAMDQLARMSLGRNEVAEARKWFERAIQDGDLDAFNGLGLLLEQVGEMTQAHSAFQQGAERGDPKALENLNRMGDLDGEPGDRQEPSEPPPRSAEAFGLAAGAISDLPSAEDLLGFTPLVEGLRALLNTRRTTLPLAIAVAAPWGAGKSSVMLQLREQLLEPGERNPQERKWWTVSFPAWKYEHSERLWAALAKAIYEQPQEEMGVMQRAWFRLRVERERLGWRKFLLKGLWPPIAAAAAVIIAIAASTDLSASKTSLAAIISSLAAFSLAATHYWGLASMPFKRAIERYASAPDYDHQLGFTADADRDIRSLARVLAPDTKDNPRALAVFVDDLDRCTSSHVVEVVEAMNQIFNSDGRHGLCIHPRPRPRGCRQEHRGRLRCDGPVSE